MTNSTLPTGGTTTTYAQAQETELENGRRLVRAHQTELRYCHTWQSWLIWDGRRWRPDANAEIERRAKHIVESLWADIPLKEDKQAWVRHCGRSSTAKGLASMVRIASSEPSIAVTSDQLDQNPWLLTVLNGTIDLRTGELLPHRQEDLITKLAPVEYDPDAECPTFLKFLETSVGDDEVIDFLQRLAGYSLTGMTSEEVLVFLWGAGRNGKSKLVDALLGVLGDYGSTAPQDLLVMGKGDSHPAVLADFHGARMVVCSEVEGGRLDVGLLKTLTGGDRLKARRMRENYWEFAPTHTLWMTANHEPVITDTTASVWERMLKVPFNRVIPAEERDRQLKQKLEKEFPGILAWAVRGCLEWQRIGLAAPEAVRLATAEYQTNMDWFGDWVGECCVNTGTAFAYTGDLYKSYTEWSARMGYKHTASQKKLTQTLKERGYTYVEQYGSARKGAFTGLGLIADPSSARAEEPF